MKKEIFAGIALVFVTGSLFLSGNHAQQPSTGSARSSQRNVVKFAFGLRNSKNDMIVELKQADVQLVYDGKPQTILSLEHFTEEPFSLAMAIDTSMSRERLGRASKQTARTFVETSMRSGTDQIAVVGFQGKLMAEQELTTDRESVLSAIERLTFSKPTSYVAGVLVGGHKSDDETIAMGATAIWDTVTSVSEGVSLPAASHTRRAILLVTDGEDTFSRATLDDAAKQALNRGVTVYAIGFGDKHYNGVNSGNLKKITSKTGGRAFFPKTYAELPAIFADISKELRSHYVVTYARSSAGPVDLSRMKVRVSGAAKDARLIYYGEYLTDASR